MSQLLTDFASIAQIVQVICTIILLVWAMFVGRDIRESIKARHLDGMKYVRDLLATPEAVEKRRWVYQDLEKAAKPLSTENLDRVRSICRDFEAIGLLCRKGLLPTDIIAETYSRNILEMWQRLKPSVDELRQTNDPYYFLEFEWLANQATKARKSLVRRPPTETLRARSGK